MATAIHKDQNIGTRANVATHRKTIDADKREKVVTAIGRVASVLSVIMYVSYVAQIGNNLSGHPGTPWQPLAAFFNCSFWTAYGWLKPKKDWPIIVANVPGILFAAVAFITSFIH